MKTFNKLALASLISLGMVSTVFADSDDMLEMQQKAETFSLISAEEAKNIAKETKPGFVDDVDLEGTGTGYQYEVEVADEQGMEWDIYIDAKTGEVVHVKQDD
ncbi:MAG TPA: PepSY domain-containing protein [Methylophaga sp.]|nr:PepSY domain-containing protein [Methylophaga sp.]